MRAILLKCEEGRIVGMIGGSLSGADLFRHEWPGLLAEHRYPQAIALCGEVVSATSVGVRFFRAPRGKTVHR